MAKLNYSDITETTVSCSFTIRELRELDLLMIEHGEDWESYSWLSRLHKDIRAMLRTIGSNLSDEGSYTQSTYESTAVYKVKPKVVDKVEDLLDDEIPY